MASASATLAVLDGTVHRELGAADVCHRDGQRVALQIAQRAAAGLVGAVREHLHRHVGLPADGAEDRAARLAFVVYFWLALYLSTTPPPSRTGAQGSDFCGKFGWVAWALSALSIKLLAMARWLACALWGTASRMRSSTSRR